MRCKINRAPNFSLTSHKRQKEQHFSCWVMRCAGGKKKSWEVDIGGRGQNYNKIKQTFHLLPDQFENPIIHVSPLFGQTEAKKLFFLRFSLKHLMLKYTTLIFSHPSVYDFVLEFANTASTKCNGRFSITHPPCCTTGWFSLQHKCREVNRSTFTHLMKGA